MELKELIKRYRAIKPSQDWIEHNRVKILALYKEQFPSTKKDLFFYFKPAFVTMAAVFFFLMSSGGLVAYAQKALPGNALYTLKRTYEKVVFVLTPASQKPVLRAELAVKRLKEVKDLVGQNGQIISSTTLQEATQNLEKEIAALKNEINLGEKIVVNSDLPIRDNKKIIEIFKNTNIDLDKILSDTKEAIQDKNLEIAMAKIGEAEEIFSGIDIEEEPIEEKIENEKEQVDDPSKEVVEDEIEVVEEKVEIKTENQVQKSSVVPLPNIKSSENSDFKIEVEFEESDSDQTN